MITPGTILIHKDAAKPKCFHLEQNDYSSEWKTVKHTLNPHELERELALAGWTFFYVAGTVNSTAYGFDQPQMLRNAMKRLIRKAKQLGCNCIEIDNASIHSFLGILPYVSITAHARHIQKGAQFSDRAVTVTAKSIPPASEPVEVLK